MKILFLLLIILIITPSFVIAANLTAEVHLTNIMILVDYMGEIFNLILSIAIVSVFASGVNTGSALQ